jgi:hypothetical protein
MPRAWFAPIVLEQVKTEEDRRLFRELIGRHHYLGHAKRAK